MDSPELFEFPPDDYRSIHADQWQEFVKDRISPQFQEFRQKQMARRKENKYPHRLGRKPYAQLQEELAATVPAGRKLVRTTMWKAARQDKDGNYLAPQVQEKVDEIDKLEKEEQEGKRKFEGPVDVLTTALGTPEYSGRVRGVGGFVKPEAYFHLPKRARLNLDARQRIKNGEEDSSSVLAAERAQWKEEKAELVGRLVRLESLLMGKDKQIVESPKSATLINDLGSGQGSCSRLDKAGVGGNEVEGVKAIKKKLDLEEGKLKTQVEADEVTKEQAPEKPLTVEEEAHVMEMAQVQSSPTVQRHHLVIDSLDNIVAEGTIVEVGVDSSSQTVHGVPLAAENIRVSVSKCLVENALLPVPIRDEIVFVSDAIGTCVAWPKDWVIPATAVGNAKQAPRKYGRKKTKQWVDTDKDDDDLEHLPADLPPALLSLSKWGNEFLKDRATIHTKLSKDLFGTERKIALFRSDLFAFTNVQEVAGDTIVMYMSFLREKLKESNMLNMIGFVDPSSLGVGNSTDRSRSLFMHFKRGKPGQFFLVPYNTGKHWILSVVSPSEELVYFMDPMKRRMDVTTDEWRTIVNQYGIPEQIGDKSCGYFIMLYMREIVQDKEQNWTKKWLTRGDEKYTMQDVDVVRQEWAEWRTFPYRVFLLERGVLSRRGLSSHYSQYGGNDMNCPTPTLRELYKGLTVLMALVVSPMLPGGISSRFLASYFALLPRELSRIASSRATLPCFSASYLESVGRATYDEPFLLQDATRRLADFTTHFIFVIDSLRETAYADGLVFFIAPNGSVLNTTLGRGGALGLPVENPTDGPSRNIGYNFVAVEFDIFKNSLTSVDDPTRNHACIDVNSLKSLNTKPWNGNITYERNNSATVSYDSSTKNLSVAFTTFVNGAQQMDYLSHQVDLKEYLPDLVIAGFSATTGDNIAVHKILSWNFSSTNLAILKPGNGVSTGLVVGMSVGGFVVLVGVLSLVWFIFWKKRKGGEGDDEDPMGLNDSIDDEFEKGTGPRKFSYSELARATNNFVEGEKVGEGGFGGVYRGFIKDLNSYVSVKRVSKGSKQGLKEYASEVRIISRLRHRNLVQLIGWCHEKGELLLVYEYMPNGSLDSHLFKLKSLLNWRVRYKIAQGLASGLFYLHEEWEQCVLHRDIKSSNIMLDSNFNVKSGDFGLARLVDHGEQSETTIVAGTRGYMALEYVTKGKT
ncbi:hypothetical protein ACLB2K_026092 [Fragaria x ananassa]